MGWASGSGLAEEVWEKVREHVPEDKRREIARAIYDLFCARDADDWWAETGGLCIDSGAMEACSKCESYTITEYLEDGLCEECVEIRNEANKENEE